MTTNNPEVQAILVTCKSKDDETVLVRAVRLIGNHDPSCVNDDWEYESLIRLSDYEAMQSEYEEELFQVRQTRDSHFGTLARAIKQIVELEAEIEKLRKASSELANWCLHEVGVDIELTPGLKQIIDITGVVYDEE